MAWVDVDRGSLTETVYSRYRSPDRTLYTYAELHTLMANWRGKHPNWGFWVYSPTAPPPVLPVHALTAQIRDRLVKELPF